MRVGSFGRRTLVGIGATTVIGSATWLRARPAARTPEITAPTKADIPPIAFERCLPALRFNPILAWTADSALLVSSAPASPGFRVETVTGNVLEEFSVPYVNIYHAILSTHEIITQTYLRGGVPFEAVDLRNGRLLFQGADPAPHSPYGAAGNVRFAVRADRSVVAVGFGPPHSDHPVTFYDTTTWQTLATVPLPPPGPAAFWSLKLSDDGKRLAYNTEDAVMVVDVTSGAVVQRLPVPLAAWFAFSPDGEMLAVAERGLVSEPNKYRHQVAVALHVFRLSDGVETARRAQTKTAFVTAIEWDPRGRFLAYLDNGGPAVHLWNLYTASDQEVVIRLTSEAVGGLALSPDGRRIAVGDGYAIDLFRIDV